MKSCPTCNRTYTDASLNFCLEDGTPLVNEPVGGVDPNATIRYTDPRDTKAPAQPSYAPPSYAPAPTIPPRATTPPREAAPPPSVQQQYQPQYQPLPPPRQKKSSAVWWILGGIVALGIVGLGAIIMIIALASMGSSSNANANRANANLRTPNLNANANVNVNANTNTNTNANLPTSVIDDFSEAKWGTGNYPFGDIWYADDEYHMRAKDQKYLVMYAPSNDYSTNNATVRVTARSVDGTPANSGFGLMVHGEKSKTGDLEDYALLIYTGEDPKYEIIEHKNGQQKAIVPWTKSSVIRTGSNTNQLEVRARGAELTFYINGQYVDRITDTENFKGGRAGLYTSDTPDVAFDDLEIKR